jgi:hypothetical protein
MSKNKYKTKSSLPEINTELIKKFASSPNGEDLVVNNAQGEHASHNEYSIEAAQHSLNTCDANSQHATASKDKANDIQGQQHSHRPVQTTDLNHSNAAAPTFEIASILFLIFIGIPLISTTFASLITKSEEFEFLFQYPALSLMFIFVPISLMVLIGHQYGELRYDHKRSQYLRRLMGLIACFGIIWIGTVLPAYAPPSSEETGDLLSEETGSVLLFSIHLTTQIFLEILIGGAIKCAFLNTKRAYRKTAYIPDEIFVASTEYAARTAKYERNQIEKANVIRCYIADHEGTKTVHIARSLAVYHEHKRTHDARQKLISLKAQLAEAQSIITLSEKDESKE